MGFGDFLKKAAKFALPVLGGAVAGPLGSAIGGAAGKLFGGGGGGNQAGINFNDPQIRNRLLVSPLERQERIGQLLRSVGSLQAQQLNRSRDTSAFLGLPAASRLAQEASIAGNIGQAAAGGVADIDAQIAQQNRAAEQFLLNAQQRQVMANQQNRQQRRQNVLGLLGDVAGTAGDILGRKFFGGGSSG